MNLLKSKILLLSVFVPFFLFVGCDEDSAPTKEPVKQLENKLIVKFQLHDSTDVAKTIFNKFEKVFFELFLGNELYQDLSYSYTGAPFIFEIMHQDTLFATLLDYTPIYFVEYTEIIKSGEEKNFKWLAPNSFGRIQANMELTFSPGIYEARIRKQSRSGYLNEIPIEINPIIFEIVE